MFRTLIYPSSGACDCVVELPHRSYCSQFVVCWRFGAAGFEWCPCCRLKHNKIASDIKLVFHSSTTCITMMHGPINISFVVCQLSIRGEALGVSVGRYSDGRAGLQIVSLLVKS